MKKSLCSLCNDTVTGDDDTLCQQCQEMDDRINDIIVNNRDVGRKYLADKFNAIADAELQKDDRRQKAYVPPRGTHTPERRVKIRRAKTVDNGSKQRKSD